MAEPYSDDLRGRVVRAVEGEVRVTSGWAIRRQREFRRQADAALSCDGKFQAF
jgi:hypothetical protein